MRSVHQDPENMVSTFFLPKQKLILLHKFWGCQEKDLKIPQATNRSLEWRGQENHSEVDYLRTGGTTPLPGGAPRPAAWACRKENNIWSQDDFQSLQKEKETGYVYQQQWYQYCLNFAV